MTNSGLKMRAILKLPFNSSSQSGQP